MSAPWMKFYPRDWRGDQALRAVSIAARGLWIECLCIMHEAKPYGHLVLNGSPVDGDTLARMTGISVDTVSALLAELRQAGVLSVTGRGVVFSRRMAKDFARSQKGKKAADKRWSQPAEPTAEIDAPSGLPSRYPTTQKPEAREQTDTKPIAQHSNSAAREGPMLFDRLLDAAGIRGNPPPWTANFGVIAALVPKGYDVDRDILAVIRARAKPDVSSWNYYLKAIEQTARDKAAIAPRPPPATEDWAGRLAVFLESATWAHAWGPKPGEPGCRVPANLPSKAA